MLSRSCIQLKSLKLALYYGCYYLHVYLDSEGGELH